MQAVERGISRCGEQATRWVRLPRGIHPVFPKGSDREERGIRRLNIKRAPVSPFEKTAHEGLVCT